jgi:hypothetical protein
MAFRVVDQHFDRVEAHRLGVDESDQELRRSSITTRSPTS